MALLACAREGVARLYNPRIIRKVERWIWPLQIRTQMCILPWPEGAHHGRTYGPTKHGVGHLTRCLNGASECDCDCVAHMDLRRRCMRKHRGATRVGHMGKTRQQAPGHPHRWLRPFTQQTSSDLEVGHRSGALFPGRVASGEAGLGARPLLGPQASANTGGGDPWGPAPALVYTSKGKLCTAVAPPPCADTT